MHHDREEIGNSDTHFGRLSHFLTNHLPLIRLVLLDRLTELHRLCATSEADATTDIKKKKNSGSYLIFGKFRVVHVLRKVSVRRDVVLPNSSDIAYLVPMLLDTALGSGWESLRQVKKKKPRSATHSLSQLKKKAPRAHLGDFTPTTPGVAHCFKSLLLLCGPWGIRASLFLGRRLDRRNGAGVINPTRRIPWGCHHG